MSVDCLKCGKGAVVTGTGTYSKGCWENSFAARFLGDLGREVTVPTKQYKVKSATYTYTFCPSCWWTTVQTVPTSPFLGWEGYAHLP